MRKADKFDCATCTRRYCDETMKIEGSLGRAPVPYWKVNGIPVRTCPLPTVTEFSREMLRLNAHYQNHHLPLDGGLLQQSAAYLRAMEIINSVPIKAE